jgi:uncharacterized membrane protein YbhN (UPF0104 family)
LSPKLKKAAFIFLKLLVSGSLMYFLLSKAGVHEVISLLKNINPYAFAFAVVAFLFIQFIASIRWGLLLPEKFSLRRLYPLYLLGAFFNIFLPGLVGGDAVKIYYLYKETGKGTQALSSVFMDRYVGLFTLIMLGLLAFPLGLGYFKGSWIEWILPAIVLGFLLTSFIVFGLRLGKSIKLLEDIYNNLHSYRNRKVVLVKAVLLSVVSHSISFVTVYIIAQGLGQHVPLLAIFIFIPIIATLSAVPLSISGIGIREAATVLLFGTIGVDPDKAIAISFAWFLSIVVGGLAGLYEYLRHKEYPSQKRPAEETPA